MAYPISRLNSRKSIGLILGPLLFVLILFGSDLQPGSPAVTRTAAAAVLIATFWITEALPIPVTSLLPLVLFPLLGIMKGKAVATHYMNSSIFLFMGGFLIALAMEKWNLHKRIALGILAVVGDSPQRLILGFMIATAFLSMWISNTATTMMMLPIGIAVAVRAEQTVGVGKAGRDFSMSLMLAIAYSASIGGIGTLIGTPPNIVFARVFTQSFPAAPAISFAKWFMLAFPLVVVFIAITWVMITKVLIPVRNIPIAGGRELIRTERLKLGRMHKAEKRIAIAFVVTAVLWIFRSNIDLGAFTIPGWASLLGLGDLVDDGTVAIGMGTLLFLIPSGIKRDEALMDWETALRLPWGILLLFGGGFALAEAFKVSGLALWISGGLASIAPLPAIIKVSGTCTLLTFLTELTSNTGATVIILPILASLARTLQIHPLLLMIPATISASCAFMLPVATPPNAIVFGSGKVPMVRMVTTGIVLNIAGIILVTALIFFIAEPLFGLVSAAIPAWALTP